MVLGSNKTGLRDSMSSKAQSSCEAAVIACVIGVLFALIGNDSEHRQFTVSRRVYAVVTPRPFCFKLAPVQCSLIRFLLPAPCTLLPSPCSLLPTRYPTVRPCEELESGEKAEPDSRLEAPCSASAAGRQGKQRAGKDVGCCVQRPAWPTGSDSCCPWPAQRQCGMHSCASGGRAGGALPSS